MVGEKHHLLKPYALPSPVGKASHDISNTYINPHSPLSLRVSHLAPQPFVVFALLCAYPILRRLLGRSSHLSAPEGGGHHYTPSQVTRPHLRSVYNLLDFKLFSGALITSTYLERCHLEWMREIPRKYDRHQRMIQFGFNHVLILFSTEFQSV